MIYGIKSTVSIIKGTEVEEPSPQIFSAASFNFGHFQVTLYSLCNHIEDTSPVKCQPTVTAQFIPVFSFKRRVCLDGRTPHLMAAVPYAYLLETQRLLQQLEHQRTTPVAVQSVTDSAVCLQCTLTQRVTVLIMHLKGKVHVL